MKFSLYTFGQGLIDAGQANLPQANADDTTLTTVFNFVYVTIGAIAFLLIVIAGLRYVMSQGDPAKITQSKNMILYTIIGLVIAALASTIVKYVLKA